jgi:hypothetical protein
VVVSDKRTSLLHDGFNERGQMFYRTGSSLSVTHSGREGDLWRRLELKKNCGKIPKVTDSSKNIFVNTG